MDVDLFETAYCALNVMYSEIKNPSWPIHTAGRASARSALGFATEKKEMPSRIYATGEWLQKKKKKMAFDEARCKATGIKCTSFVISRRGKRL